jgi:hypothetical protein
VQGGDVRHTMINGRLVMEDRILLTIDEEDAMADVRRMAKAIGQADSTSEQIN